LPDTARPWAYTLASHPRTEVLAMAPTHGSQRALDPEPPLFEPLAKRAGARPGGVPVATTIVLFVVVAALLAFIAWL